ncbi:MAG TPA: AMP-binding protein, partial [Longimicrobium sp.]|nr:AMP-binding protein [Longimicrobium sp.]
MTAETLCDALDAACGRWTTRTALSSGGARTTYGELRDQVAARAADYRRLGVRRGDRIVCQMPNRPEHLVAAFAAWYCGAVYVGAHPALTARELSTLVRLTGAALVVHEGQDPPPSVAALRRARPEPRL